MTKENIYKKKFLYSREKSVFCKTKEDNLYFGKF